MVINSVKCFGDISRTNVSCIPALGHVINNKSSCMNGKATFMSFCLSDVTKKGSDLLIVQCSKTFDTIGLMAMAVKRCQLLSTNQSK